MAVMRFDLPDLCDCGKCGPKCGTKHVCCPVIEKRTPCGVVKKIIQPGCHHVVPVNACVPVNQVYLDYHNMCEIWYPNACHGIELTKVSPLTYQIGIPPSLRGKLRIKLDVIQDCPRRRRKEETYTINLNFDDE